MIVQAASLYNAHVAPGLTVTETGWLITPVLAAIDTVILLPLIVAPAGDITPVT